MTMRCVSSTNTNAHRTTHGTDTYTTHNTTQHAQHQPTQRTHNHTTQRTHNTTQDVNTVAQAQARTGGAALALVGEDLLVDRHLGLVGAHLRARAAYLLALVACVVHEGESRQLLAADAIGDHALAAIGYLDAAEADVVDGDAALPARLARAVDATRRRVRGSLSRTHTRTTTAQTQETGEREPLSHTYAHYQCTDPHTHTQCTTRTYARRTTNISHRHTWHALDGDVGRLGDGERLADEDFVPRVVLVALLVVLIGKFSVVY